MKTLVSLTIAAVLSINSANACQGIPFSHGPCPGQGPDWQAERNFDACEDRFGWQSDYCNAQRDRDLDVDQRLKELEENQQQ